MTSPTEIFLKAKSGFSNFGEESTLEALYNPRNNAFDFMRFVLASLVIYSHAYPLLYGTSVPERFARLTSGQETLGGVAVAGFFTISGFLVTQSFLQSSSYSSYLIKRFLRLFPALIVSSFVTAFILGPLLTELSGREFLFGNYGESPWRYFIKNSSANILGYAYTLRDLFKDNPYPRAVNGSLWTIKHEFAAYMMVLALGYFGIYKHRKLLLIFTGFTIFLYFANHHSGFMLWSLKSPRWWAFHTGEYPFLVKLISYFLMGSILYVWKDKVIYSGKFLFIAILAIVLSVPMGIYQDVALFALPYTIISISLVWPFQQFSKHGDFSYGIYIYAFPVQQTISYFFASQIHSAARFAAYSFLITLVLAILSWKYVEKPALNLKKKFNGTVKVSTLQLDKQEAAHE